MLMSSWMKIVQLMNWLMLSKETEFIFQPFMFWIKLIKFLSKNLMLFIKFHIVCQLVPITRFVWPTKSGFSWFPEKSDYYWLSESSSSIRNMVFSGILMICWKRSGSIWILLEFTQNQKANCPIIMNRLSWEEIIERWKDLSTKSIGRYWRILNMLSCGVHLLNTIPRFVCTLERALHDHMCSRIRTKINFSACW